MLRLSEKMLIFDPSFVNNIRLHRGELLSFDPPENLQNSKYKGEKSESCFSCSSIYKAYSHVEKIILRSSLANVCRRRWQHVPSSRPICSVVQKHPWSNCVRHSHARILMPIIGITTTQTSSICTLKRSMKQASHVWSSRLRNARDSLLWLNGISIFVMSDYCLWLMGHKKQCV